MGICLLFIIQAIGEVNVRACGPFFPNYMLVNGDEPVLAGARVAFKAELERMNLGWSKHRAVQETPIEEQSSGAELQDLRTALTRNKVPTAEMERIIKAHQEARNRLADYLTALEKWECSRSWVELEGKLQRGEAAGPAPEIPNIVIVPGLPAEFADYFEGAVIWHNGACQDKAAARQCWERLLARPESQRRFKSTWAAFMLGRFCEKNDPEKAIQYFAQTRSLTGRGFVDSAGLAAASLGREALVRLNQTEFKEAIHLYLDQLATGDYSAPASLQYVANKVLRSSPGVLEQLARDSRAQRVITAFIISQYPASEPQEMSVRVDMEMTRRWLQAMEAAGVKDLEAAEKLALAAYNANDAEAARRWIDTAKQSPLAQWLKAKLLLRDGKANDAAALLAKVVRAWPAEPQTTNTPPPQTLKDTLWAANKRGPEVLAGRQALADLGTIRLARLEFTQALDSLLNAGYWMDAAYVAERVLTLDELKSYVDRFWPAEVEAQVRQEKEKYGDDEISPAKLREQIRYLLARRLTRSSRSEEARDYYPPAWVPQFDSFIQALSAGWNEALLLPDRAVALFKAAIITRTNGMELIGTEVEPDWHIHDGQFEEGVSRADRAANSGKVLHASDEELKRAAEHSPEPPTRFHYRYQAASLAWEAAKLLPDNSDLTALVLCRGGSWLKSRDPKMADIFYKALVRRNRRTLLGAEADRCRWFPELDDEGKIVPRPALNQNTKLDLTAVQQENADPDTDVGNSPSLAMEESGTAMADAQSATESTSPFFRYIVQKGDTLARIAQRCSEAGIFTRFEDMFQANPGLDGARLKVGQVIRIPLLAPGSASHED